MNHRPSSRNHSFHLTWQTILKWAIRWPIIFKYLEKKNFWMQKTLVKNDFFEILITFYGLRHFFVYPNTIGGCHGSWIYNYLCNQCLSPQTLWIRIPLMARCTWYNIMWWSLSVTYYRSMVFCWYSGFHHQ